MVALKIRILKGVFWNSFQVFINKSFSFIIKLLLARLLFPEEFGLVGMAVVFISFIEVFNDLGIGSALVQRKNEDIRESHFHTAFWTGVFWSFFVFIVLVFAVAPLASHFYNEPILEKIIPLLSLGVLSSPINLVHNAQLTKAMNFKKLAFINNFSSIFSGILSLVLALLGAGVWSLVFNSVATFLIAMPMYFRATNWFPKFIWEKEAFNDIFGFGIYTTGTNLFNNLIDKFDYLLIGKFFSASVLGAYTLAFVLTDTFRKELMGIMNKVMYPVYGLKQNDPQSLKNYYLKVVKYNSLLVYPIMAVLLVLSEPIIINFFGVKWLETVVPLRIISLSVIFHMMANSNSVLIRGMGRAKLEFRIQFFKAVFLFVPIISFGIYYYGIIGASIAILINKIINVIIAQYFLRKLIGISLIDLFLALRSPVSGLLVSLAVGFISYNFFVLHFFFCAILMLVIYMIINWILMGDELKESYFILKPKKAEVVK
ncbi:lipopolysaccharide biosynthesis protein [Algoriphagus hitonicola]|uniref:Membrane protein involved in the export of O-antigen and teichoic acid n=1 Tax=Algoriphagus hitonicola TaxID=435880 RepID=A0A1I2X4S2_9BACT|nr:lipopolysaccharide biosynthesis protein [Algoriphagus hitonicola]SFH08543.1 Membrane protein involved in the export of O-antigen and teichoic acid [Algoriphagus hitonicola]